MKKDKLKSICIPKYKQYLLFTIFALKNFAFKLQIECSDFDVGCGFKISFNWKRKSRNDYSEMVIQCVHAYYCKALQVVEKMCYIG